MAEQNVEASVWVSPDEFVEWNRAAGRANSDLSAWVRAVVNARLASPAPREARRTAAPRTTPLEWLDEEGWIRCEYCGHYLDFAATRRKRFCSDICRVRAWRFRKRQPAV